MGDFGGGKQIGGIWDKKAAQVQGTRQPDADKAFQRTRMAPAVSHEKGMDYQKMAPKLEKPLGARPREARMSTRPVSGRRR